METIEERAEKYYQSLARPLADIKGLVTTAYCLGAETERLLKHDVMQGAHPTEEKGATEQLGNEAVDTNAEGEELLCFCANGGREGLHGICTNCGNYVGSSREGHL